MLTNKKRDALLSALGLVAIVASSPALAEEANSESMIEEGCGPATLDMDFTLSVPCLTVEEGQPAPAGNYRLTWKYNPKFTPFDNSDNIWRWDLTESSPATCSASANCGYIAYDFTQIMLPQVNFETQPFYTLSLLFDGTSSAWYNAHFTEDSRLTADTMPAVDIDRGSPLQNSCDTSVGSYAPSSTQPDSDGDGMNDAYEASMPLS